MTASFAHSYTHRLLLLLLTITRIRVDTVGVNGWRQLSCFPTVHSFDAELAKIGRMCEHAIGGACLGAFTILENWKSCCDFSAAGRRPCGKRTTIAPCQSSFNTSSTPLMAFGASLYALAYACIHVATFICWRRQWLAEMQRSDA